MMQKLILIFTAFILISCNFESGSEEESGGGLFTDHKLATNSLLLLPPLNKTYRAGANIDLTLRHANSLTVGGSPRISLNLDGSIVYANYLAGSGTKNISFRYTVQAGDNDINGIEINSDIDLNGGTITFAVNGALNNVATSYSTVTTASILIDTSIPTITSVTPPLPKIYLVNQTFDFLVNFSEAVTISGTPRISLNIGGSIVYANYISGSNTTSLIFRYTVQATNIDLDGITSASPIELNGGSINDASLNPATLIYSAIPMSTVLVNGDIPYVKQVTPPTSKTYLLGEKLSISLKFTEAVNTSGSPRVGFNIGSDPRFFEYASGTGTDTLVFEYIVLPGVEDIDGILIGNTIDFNGGSIQDGNLNNSILLIATPLTPTVLVDAGTPQVTTIFHPANNTYLETQDLFFTLVFDKVVNTTGVPRLPIMLNSSNPIPINAVYTSGSGGKNLVFKYTVQSGDLDSDGIVIQSLLDLNGGTIKGLNTVGANLNMTAPISILNTSALLIDAAPASISGVTAPINGSYITTNNLNFVITFTKNIDVLGTPRVELTIGAATVYADYLSGTGTSAITFGYTIQAPDTDTDGIAISNTSIDLNGGTLKDSFSNDSLIDMTAHIPDLTGVFVNNAVVTITSITPPIDATYIESSQLDFTVNTSQLVNIIGTPKLAIDIGGVTKYADYISGTGTSVLLYRYTVEVALGDIDGIELVSPMELSGGTIKSLALDDLGLSFIPPVMTSVLVDSIVPTITSITPPADTTYILLDDIDFIINTDEAVNITGTPRISIDIGGATKYANYISGTGSSALTFRYTVEPGLTDVDGISISSPLDLNSGTIQNTDLENLTLTFTPPVMTSVLVGSTVPTISSITPPADSTYIETQNIEFTANLTENVDVTGTPRFSIDIGGVTKYADYISGTGTSSLLFRYTVETSLLDNDGITITSPLDLNSGTIKNSGLDDLYLVFTPPVMTSVFVDSSAPIVSITSPVDTSLINISNDSATFTITGTCDENGQTVLIEVDAVAASLPVGFSCDGSNFSGTIDTTGLSAGAHTLVAKLSDSVPLEGVSTTINLIKDITAPVISSITPPSNSYYIEGQFLDFIVNLDENTIVTGSPRIQLDIGGSTKYAVYNSGTGTSALIFRYTTLSGDNDNDGISFSSTLIDLNAGTLLDVSDNPINLNLDATIALPNLTSVFVDAVIPLVSITSAGNITAANEVTYSVSGTCSDNGQIVSVSIGGIPKTPLCTSGAWDTGATNVSGLGDTPSLPITADHTDAAGNTAVQASTAVDKNAATPQVGITLAQSITAANQTSYPVSGTCTENGTIVDVNIGSINIQPNCSAGTWTTGDVDVSALVDNPAILITADHSTATQATTNVSKDTVSPTVTISSSPNINQANETNYVASGTCSENAVMVDINIGLLNFTPNCNSGSWTTGSIDVSTLVDGASINFTADHSTAPQAITTISKNTASPTVANLTVPTTLKDSENLNWSLNDPGGFTLDDYDINYRVKGNPTWLSFADGISLNINATVNSLLASTTYEFRVRVQYDTSSYSDWSNTAEGETKPDNPIFDSPNAAMNVAGATTTNVVAFYDNTAVTLNGIPIAGSPLSKGQTVNITTAQFDIIDADKPIYTAGRRGSGGNTAKANIVWQPTAWAGKKFSFNAIRTNPQQLHIYAIENASIEVKQGSTVLASTTLTAGNGGVISWSVYGSYQVVSTGTILAYHTSGNPASALVDPKPLLPSALEIIGFPSNSMRITTDKDSTNYNLIHADSSIGSGSLSKQDSTQINPQGGNSSLYQGNSLIISADQKIAGASFADSNGNCAAPFLPTNLMKKNYAINAPADYVAFASKIPGTIEVRDSSDTVIETLTLTRTGSNPNAPYKARRGTTTGGYRFFATVPVAGWYQPNSDTGGADQDETILYGTDE